MEKTFFGDKLKEFRAKSGLTQQALAKAAGLTITAINHLETGHRSPSWPTVQKIACALGLKTDDFKNCEELAQAPAREPAAKRRRGRPKVN